MAFCGNRRAATRTVLEDVHATRGSSATDTRTRTTNDDASSLGKGGVMAVPAIKSLRCTDVGRAAILLAKASSGDPYVAGSHVPVLDPSTGNLCLAMAGPSLSDFLSDKPPLPEDSVRAFMRQLLTGANTMHERGIVHRDIKPANILVGEDGKTVQICGLELAMSLATEPQPYDKVGTASYMAPEVLLSKPDYDARVDAWSLGCVMAEMLTGGEALFEFKGDNARHLRTISSVIGTPERPGFTSLLGRQRQRSRLRELFPMETLSKDGLQVLAGLLACDPGKRLTAAEALKLPWFGAPPSRQAAAAAAKISTLALLRKKVEAALPARKEGLRAKIIQPKKKTDSMLPPFLKRRVNVFEVNV